MSSKPWFAWYPADYQAKTSHLSFIEDSAYRKLIDAYFNRGGLMGFDRGGLFRITGAQSDQEKAAVDKVASEFFYVENNMLRHHRADEELEKQVQIKARLSEAGKRGGLIAGRGRPIVSDRPPLGILTSTVTVKSNTSALNGKIMLDSSGRWNNLKTDQIELWKKAYPAIDIGIQLNAAAAWILANPKNKKSNYSRFITNWLSRAQDKAPRNTEQSRMGKFVI